MLRYEDLVLHPIEILAQLDKFLKLKYTIFDDYYIKKKLVLLPSDEKFFNLIGTSRVPKTRHTVWREEIPFYITRKIQTDCGEVLSKLQYRMFNNEIDYKNYSISIYI